MLPILEMEKRKELLADVIRAMGFPRRSPISGHAHGEEQDELSAHDERAYSDLVDEKEGRVKGTVWSAFPLDSAVQARIERHSKKSGRKTVILNPDGR